MAKFTPKHLHKLFKFEQNATESDFVQMFGRNGPHLWQKFVNTDNHKIISFSRALDASNAKQLIDYLNK